MNQTQINNDGTGGIILYAKRPGVTSFSSLFTIKHALDTSRVGHTGTLDSFASGLLVVCAGPLTRLVSRITEFDKTYDAVIEFGKETDTLEWTGQIIRESPLPSKDNVLAAVKKFTGSFMQTPPLFSAIHINGQRACTIARSGRELEIPARKITVSSAEIEEWLFTDDEKVKAVRVKFSVSKGTYIRSLARDIAADCSSAGHLAGLRRLTVGSFRLEDAAGFSLLKPFTIANVYKEIQIQKNIKLENQNQPEEKKHQKYIPTEKELALQDEVRRTMRSMNESFAEECGFKSVHVLKESQNDFRNGMTLKASMFVEKNIPVSENPSAVFTENGKFAGMIQRNLMGAQYIFVIPM